uniref:CS domain-containing protein n=1 Tax=Pseudo-nitzschia australis TaxID=44445 RepID=A0A7S4A9P6_9STRA|mmetsp:Transcript_4880/g.10771  ORF Transcript_4880/g.10771 Transcript_4880/m.10771 type:complete len:401 (-) Transcript_4880:240-1442(-)
MSLPIPTTGNSSYGRPNAIDPRQLQAMDAPLVALTQQCKGDLRQLMYAFFSFLNRRTDFYLVPHSEDARQGKSKMGFAEGDAEKMLLAAFRQFPLRRIPKGGAPAGKKAPAPSTKTKTKKESPSSKSDVADKKAEKKAQINKGSSSKEKAELSKEDGTNKNPKTKGEGDDNKGGAEVPSNMKDVRYNEEGLQVPVGNGGSTPRYKWTQTIDETSVLIGIPKDFRGKDYEVLITASALSVKAKKCLPGEEKPRTFAEGKLVDNIRVDESTWSVEGGVMIITLEKKTKKFWTAVYEDDIEKYKIDTELVDSRRRIEEYDDATQAQFRKTIFDQNQYHLDGPTSDEILGKTNKGGGNKMGIPGLPPGMEIKDIANNNADIKDLPLGVEYINKKTLDEAEKGKK